MLLIVCLSKIVEYRRPFVDRVQVGVSLYAITGHECARPLEPEGFITVQKYANFAVWESLFLGRLGHFTSVHGP